jgi:urease alpha subunit
VVHSDSAITIQRLNQEAAKVMYRANENGFALKEEDAIQWITANAAKSLGIHDKVGSLEAGKNADVVVWNMNPFSVYAQAEQVFIDGAKFYDRIDDKYQSKSDFLLGQQLNSHVNKVTDKSVVNPVNQPATKRVTKE